MRIIHITPSIFGLKQETNWNLDFKELHYEGTWQQHFARKTLEYNSNYEIEGWTIYDQKHYGNRGISEVEKYGIKFRSFPGFEIGSNAVSLEMIKKIRYLISRGEKILIHLQSVYGIMQYLIAIQCKKVPLVAQQRGPNSPPSWRFRFRRKMHYYLLSFFNRFSMKFFDFIFASSKGEYVYVSKNFGEEKVMHMKGSGIDFENFRIKSKLEVKKDLGLEIDKKYMLHVGRFEKIKGVHKVISIYKSLKKNNDNIGLIFIGGHESQPLYDVVIKSGAEVVKGFLPKNEVIKYMNATDIHLLPTQDKEWIPFGDMPTALIESLVMNQFVVSPMLIHFIGSKRDLSKIGVVPLSDDDSIRICKEILEISVESKDTRAIMKKYYGWKRVIKSNTMIYNKLFAKYYETY